MRVVWTASAKDDLRTIGRLIARDNPVAALNLVRRIRSAVARLADHSHIGRPGRVDNTREYVVSGTRFIVPYRVTGSRVEVLAVVHEARLWPDAFQ
jgi:addiction module RelE/StbE family toxin